MESGSSLCSFLWPMNVELFFSATAESSLSLILEVQLSPRRRDVWFLGLNLRNLKSVPLVLWTSVLTSVPLSKKGSLTSNHFSSGRHLHENSERSSGLWKSWKSQLSWGEDCASVDTSWPSCQVLCVWSWLCSWVPERSRSSPLGLESLVACR